MTNTELYIVDSRDALAPPHLGQHPRLPYVLCRSDGDAEILWPVDRYPSRAEAVTARLAALGIVGALMLASTAANAYTVTLDPLPADFSDFNIFASEIANTDIAPAPFFAGGYEFSGSAIVANGYDPGLSAPPVSMDYPFSYLAVQQGDVEAVLLPSMATSFTVLWSSIDPGNAWTLGSTTITGQDINDAGIFGSGLITISGLAPFNIAIASSSITSNEFALPGIAPAVPEASTWAMMLLGLAGLGYAAMRREEASR